MLKMKYEIPKELNLQILDWKEKQVEKMKDANNGEMPYLGASGGLWTYSFTDTSIGRVIKIINNFNKEELSFFEG